MNIIICGAGEVGQHTAEVLNAVGDNITIIDLSEEKLAALEETLDVRCLQGNCTHANVLNEAGVDEADLFVAVTNNDEINLLAASIASGLGAARTIARVHHAVYYEGQGLNYERHLGINHLVNPEHSTAKAIAQSLQNPGALAVERFARGKIEMQQLVVTAGAAAVNKELNTLDMPRSVRLAVMERKGLAFIPDAHTVIHEGDIVTLVGEVRNFDKARVLFDKHPLSSQRVIMMGGSPLAVWLCRAMRSRHFSIRLYETDRKRSEELAAKLDWVTVYRGDPLDADSMNELRIDQTDAFVALTNDDEHNILAAARAKSMGVGVAIAVLARGTYLHLLKHVGIDRAFSPRVTAVAEIQALLDVGPVRKLATLAEGIADVFEIRVASGALEVVGKPLKDLHFPVRAIVAAIQRGDDVTVPGAMDSIQAGDTLIVIGPSQTRRELLKMFGIS